MREIGEVPLAALPALLGAPEDGRVTLTHERFQEIRQARAEGLIHGW